MPESVNGRDDYRHSDGVNGSLRVGQMVYLNTDNPYLHGHEAKVKEVTEYGAVVACLAAATGEYRAARKEMTYHPPLSVPEEYPLELPRYPDGEGHADDTILENGPPPPQFEAKEMGFTGNACGQCGSFMMVRSGTCEKCNQCGATSGCS